MKHLLAVVAIALISCGGETPTAPIANPSPVAPLQAADTGTPIVAWGDSLTSGFGASSRGTAYPADLASLLGRRVVNEGVSGQSSSQIAARQGGVPALLTLAGDMIPPEGPAAIQAASVWPVTPPRPTLAGALVGVPGVLSLHSAASRSRSA